MTQTTSTASLLVKNEIVEFKTGLVPMTYAEAGDLYRRNGQKSFSFVAAPYGVAKTIVRDGSHIVAAPPSSFLVR